MEPETKHFDYKNADIQESMTKIAFFVFYFCIEFSLLQANLIFLLHAIFSHQPKMDSTTQHLNTNAQTQRVRQNMHFFIFSFCMEMVSASKQFKF